MVTYHIQTDEQNQMLRDKYGLTGNDPYNFPVFEREIPLSGPFPEVVQGTYNVNHEALVAAYQPGCHEAENQG